MIKKVIIKNLSSSLTYNGLGSIIFYDYDNKIISSGNVITKSISIGETDNFICTPSETRAGSYPVDIINTNSTGYWHTNVKSNVSIEITFKNYIDNISYFTIIPTPTFNIGVTNDFEVDFYDETNALSHSYSVTPTTVAKDVQKINTPELSSVYLTDTLGLITTTDSGKLKNINKILSVKVEQEEPVDTTVRYLFSIDNKSTYFSIINNTMEIVDINDILIKGMNKISIESINNYDFSNTIDLDIIVGIESKNKNLTPIAKNIKIQYS